MLKYLIAAALLCFSAACSASDTVAPPGFLEGSLRIISPAPVDLADGHPSTVIHESFAEYPLVVLSQDRKHEITRFAADEKGNYRVVLPAGTYVLDVQDRRRKHLRATPQLFIVISNQTVRVNMEIDTGVR